MEMSGKVVHVGETEVFGSGFQKRILVFEAKDGDYLNQYGCVAMKDNVTKFDGILVGQDVVVEVFDNSVGKVREWQGKWFSDMPTCMKVSVSGTGTPASGPATNSKGEEEDDDFAF